MNTSDYGKLLEVAFFLYGAVHYTFSQPLFGHAARWPWGGYLMSSFSRWLLFSSFIQLVLYKIARGFFHLKPSFVVGIVAILFVIALIAAYFKDRRRARTQG